jgi:hypothetical protein
VSTLGVWLIAGALYAYYYVVTILALPEPYDAYARNWQFQLFAFSIVRLPILILVLALIIYLEVVVTRRRTRPMQNVDSTIQIRTLPTSSSLGE